MPTSMSVAAPLKIWNNTRIEMNLEKHQQFCSRRGWTAFEPINPHFLFNTLIRVVFDSNGSGYDARVLKLDNICAALAQA